MKKEMNIKPEGWRNYVLSDVCDILSGSTPKTSEDQFWNGSISWFTPLDLSKIKSRHVKISERKITKAGFKSCSAQLIPPYSLIMSSRAPIGYFAINLEEATTNQGCKSFVCFKDIDVEFLYYYLNKNIKHIKRLGSGSTFEEVGKKQLEGLEILIPPKLEQIRIATILSKVDEEIEKVEQIIEQTEKLKKGLMQELLTKGIGHKKFKKSVLGEIPEEWEVSTLNEISENLDNKRIPITKSKRKHGTYPYYGASGIVDYVNDYIFDEELLLISEDGANLLDRNYPIAFTATGKFWVNNHSHIHRFNDKYLQKIIEFYLNNKNLEKYLTGMAQPKLNKQRLFCIPIPIPKNPKEIKSISIILSTIDEKFIKYKQISLCLNNLKKGIMSDLLSGKKRVI